MTKRALLVAINYVGTDHALRGCINDSNNVKAMLESQGFTEIEQIHEKAATTAGILAGLNRLVANATAGDVLVFHYSGHGSQTYSTLEADSMDEIICPIDLDWIKNVITDNELKAIFNPVPNGVNVTVILDCCHSGTALDQDQSANVEIKEIKSMGKVKVVKKSLKGRHLPPPDFIQDRIKKEKLELREWSTSRDINQSALLIAACHSNQTSADATINGIPQGAGTASMLAAFKENPNITYQEMIDSMNNFMIVNKFEQRPELDGSPNLYNKKFLSEWADITPVIQSVVEQPITIPENVSTDIKKNDTAKIIAILVVLAIAIIIFA